ncbi:hypothetical protein Caci_0184 [Catenulispora acidiphila DSM 44928]|uniref:Uncharacterized protein n=1 Tax=Catenulispora acidiphila (strain DSM 44928 / JCM 14897 / NBRC 102108 / NRRL B-24433 / ID139908) TaxID=479433 RepID=C7QIZ7_CATAD|nr:hypothetical protein [Catenulispora acidiphila]ACU69139.1 hypothetical protein Caci_0184 [Catenulispora acidiphila DSM 44928]
MRTRAIFTAAAATAATLGGVLASAGTAAATTTKTTTPSRPTAPQASPTPGVLAVENALELADDWCVAPLHFAGPLAADPLPTASHACGHGRAGGGVRVLSDLCIAPITTDDPSGSWAAPSTPCKNAGSAGSGFGILRDVSVAGVQATF